MKNTWKKVTSVFLTTAMAASLLTGCGNSGKVATTSEKENSSGNEIVKITYYSNPNTNNNINDAVKLFEAKNPNIKVSVVEMPSESTKKQQTLSTVLQAKDSAMDVFAIDATWPESYYSAGWVEPLDDVYTEKELGEFLPGPIQAGRASDGKLYALPLFMDAGFLLYRKDLLDKYGYQPPKTWDELIKQSKDIMSKEPGIKTGFTTHWKQFEGLTCSALEFVRDYGGDILDNKGKVILNSKETEAGLQKMFDMMYTDKVAEGNNANATADARAVFNSGNAIFLRDWGTSYAISQIPDNSKVVGKVGITELPGGPAGKSSTLGGWSVAVSAFSKHKAEAKKFVKFITSYDSVKIDTIAASHIPALKAIYDDADVQKSIPVIKEMRASAESSQARPRTAYYEELSGVLQQGFSSILAKKTSIPDALKSMAPQIEEIMKR